MQSVVPHTLKIKKKTDEKREKKPDSGRDGAEGRKDAGRVPTQHPLVGLEQKAHARDTINLVKGSGNSREIERVLKSCS